MLNTLSPYWRIYFWACDLAVVSADHGIQGNIGRDRVIIMVWRRDI